MFGTPDEPAVTIQQELRGAQRWLRDIEDAPRDGRMADPVRWWDALCAAQERVKRLERELAEATE